MAQMKRAVSQSHSLEVLFQLAPDADFSTGYPEDVDHGEWFTFTGEGGRDLKGTPGSPKNLRTGPQTKDQTLTKYAL